MPGIVPDKASVTIDGDTIEVVKEFVYFRTV